MMAAGYRESVFFSDVASGEAPAVLDPVYAGSTKWADSVGETKTKSTRSRDGKVESGGSIREELGGGGGGGSLIQTLHMHGRNYQTVKKSLRKVKSLKHNLKKKIKWACLGIKREWQAAGPI